MCKSKGIKNISRKKSEKAAKPAKQEEERGLNCVYVRLLFNEMTLKGFDSEPGFK